MTTFGWYHITLPITNDLPALSVVSMHMSARNSELALAQAIAFATNHGYVLDNDRAASVELD
jgi:hypothetical protein